MNKKMRNLFVWSCLLICLPAFGQTLLIKNINIIPIYEKGMIKNKSVLIEDGRITKIGSFKKMPKVSKEYIIEGKGKYLMPGLADMHVHLVEEDKVGNQLLNYTAAGVTHIRVMDSKSDQLAVMEEKKKGKYPYAPNIFFSKVVKRDESYSEKQADSLMAVVRKSGLSFIKLFGLSNESTLHNLMNAAQRNGIIVCGHYPVLRRFGKAVMIGMDTVFHLKFKSVEHLGGYVNYPNEKLDEIVKLTKDHQVYNCPTLDWDIMSYDLQYPDNYKNRVTYALLPKNIIENWEADYKKAIEKAGGAEKVIENRNKYQATFNKKTSLLLKLHQNDCLLLLGGDAGNTFQAEGFNIYEEMVNWSGIGIDNYSILKSATFNAAKFFNQEGSWGSIKEGFRADLIILDKNPLEDIKNITTVRYTVTNGKPVMNKALFDQVQ